MPPGENSYSIGIMKKGLFCAFAAIAIGGATTEAAFLIEVDTDGADDAVLTFSPNFSFGGDTTTASQSSPSSAFGMSGGDSIFGGNGSAFDTYVFSYDPSVDADNLAITAGTDLGSGNLASGITGGAPGVYSVYVTWPFTANVSGGPTNFSVTTAGDSFSTSLDQNAGGAGAGNEWFLLGDINWTGGAITLTQESTAATFVSMRSAGALFEAIPEPASGVLALFAAGLLGARRRR